MSTAQLRTHLEDTLVAYLESLPELAGREIRAGHDTRVLTNDTRYIVVSAALQPGRFAHAGIYEADVTIIAMTLATPEGMQQGAADVATVEAALQPVNRAAAKLFFDGRDQPGISCWKFQGTTDGSDEEKRRRGDAVAYTFTCHLK